MATAYRVVEELPATGFHSVRSLQELAAINAIGLAYIKLMRPTKHEVCIALAQFDLPAPVNDLISQLAGPVISAVEQWYYTDFSPAWRCSTSNKWAGISEMSARQEFALENGLHWMWCGLLDCDKMARLMIQDERFGVAGRFAIACKYCFPGDVYSLWELLPPNKKAAVFDDTDLVKYWKAVVQGEIHLLVKDTVWETEKYYGMDAAINVGNLSAIKYFWIRIGEEQRWGRLFLFAHLAYHSSLESSSSYQPIVEPFFLQHIVDGWRKRMVVGGLETVCNLLVCLLKWPWEDLFVPVVEYAWNHAGDISVLRDTLFGLFRLIVRGFNIRELKVSGIAIYIWWKLELHQKVEFFSPNQFKPKVGALIARASHPFIVVVFGGVNPDTLKSLALSDECIKFTSDHAKCNNWEVVARVVKYLLPRDMRELNRYEYKLIVSLFEGFDGGADSSSLPTFTILSFSTKFQQLKSEHFGCG